MKLTMVLVIYFNAEHSTSFDRILHFAHVYDEVFDLAIKIILVDPPR
jgi:hypothetical protein